MMKLPGARPSPGSRAGSPGRLRLLFRGLLRGRLRRALLGGAAVPVHQDLKQVNIDDEQGRQAHEVSTAVQVHRLHQEFGGQEADEQPEEKGKQPVHGAILSNRRGNGKGRRGHCRSSSLTGPGSSRYLYRLKAVILVAGGPGGQVGAGDPRVGNYQRAAQTWATCKTCCNSSSPV